MTVTAPTRSLLALLALAGTLALNAPDAEARRFGGGRSIGMSHSTPTPVHVPHHETHYDSHVTAPTPTLRYQAPLPPTETRFRSTNYGSDVNHTVLRSESLGIARRLRASEQPAPSAYPPGDSGSSEEALRIIEASRRSEAQRQENARSPRVADPRFARITENVAPSRPCEFKPVMSDDDYIVCGANPPSFPAGR
ncbi:hypothetical protein [Zoogloea sp.]|uniref:hypothetical protein n=1 Tax=Zoogloea sp. TaxID=49181 RepID=UPI0025FA4FE4|nr:hypothetical protein [Zoogloea sp.]MCK6394342.1 hypothetical protein [Zoogloea sp.]